MFDFCCTSPNTKMSSNYYFRNLRKVIVACYSNKLLQPCAKDFIFPFNGSLSQPLYSVHRLKTSVTEESLTKQSVLRAMLRKVGWLNFSRSKLARTGYYLYESVADGVNYWSFFKEFDLEDSFFSWFLITELHVWMLLVRVMAEGEEGRFVRNRVVEAMWGDVSTRAKKLDAISSSYLSTQMTVLSEQFQAAIIGYDEGLLSEDAVLAGAIWRRFFAQKCSDPEQIECLVKYIRKQVKNLDELPRESVLLSPSIKWIPLESSDSLHLQ